MGDEPARDQVGHDSEQPLAEHAEHHQVGVPDDPIGEVDQRLKRQRRLQGTLKQVMK